MNKIPLSIIFLETHSGGGGVGYRPRKSVFVRFACPTKNNPGYVPGAALSSLLFNFHIY